nr:hypothetical protein [Leifsonia sp. Leaf325]
MGCDTYPISCQLERLNDHLTGPDWADFWGTIAATVVGTVVGALIGSGVALYGTWLIYRRQTEDRYEERIEAAVSTLLHSIAAYVASLEAYVTIAREASRQNRLATPDPIPGTLGLVAAVNAVAIVARKPADASVIADVRTRVRSIERDTTPMVRIATLSQLVDALSSWRANDEPAKRGFGRT